MNTWIKIAFIISVLIVILFLGHFNRYQIIATDGGVAYKLDRLHGKVTLLMGRGEYQTRPVRE